MPRRREIVVGSVYLPRPTRGAAKRKFRRVIEVRDDVVIYSSGGDINYFCSVKSFKEYTLRDPVVASCLDSCDDLLKST